MIENLLSMKVLLIVFEKKFLSTYYDVRRIFLKRCFLIMLKLIFSNLAEKLKGDLKQLKPSVVKPKLHRSLQSIFSHSHTFFSFSVFSPTYINMLKIQKLLIHLLERGRFFSSQTNNLKKSKNKLRMNFLMFFAVRCFLCCALG